jgi:small subunit ribosomal protein S18
MPNRNKGKPDGETNDLIPMVQELANTIRSPQGATMQQTKEKMGDLYRNQDFERFQSRRWKEGDVYAPHDLSWEEMQKWRKRGQVPVDAFDALGINPLHEYKVATRLGWQPCG